MMTGIILRRSRVRQRFAASSLRHSDAVILTASSLRHNDAVILKRALLRASKDVPRTHPSRLADL